MRPVFVTLSAFLYAVAQPVFSATDSAPPTREIVPNSYLVTFKSSSAKFASPILPALSAEEASRQPPKPFGEHSSGQSREELARTLNLNGQVARIFDVINAAHLHIDSAEAERLKQDPRVLRVEPNTISRSFQVTQSNPRWALDRLDQAAPPLNSAYTYGASGAGQTIYILDSGINLKYTAVKNEFGSRASIIWDVNYPNGPVNTAYGEDCLDHGTAVASAAAGNVHGVAKGATVIVAKVSNGCDNAVSQDTWIAAFTWLASYAPKGAIVNKSFGPPAPGLFVCGFGVYEPTIEASIRAAYNRGVIIVQAAGNDGCDIAKFTPTGMPEVFVVGATDQSRFGNSQDTRAYYPGSWASRYGANMATFAPGTNVQVLDYLGYSNTKSGTSFSAPFIAGMFAVACQFYASNSPNCSTMANPSVAYDAMKSFGEMGKVVDPGGALLPGSTPSRFIWRRTW